MIKLKPGVQAKNYSSHTPSCTSLKSVFNKSMDLTPLPDALKVQPIQQQADMLSVLQKEWQNVVHKSLFEYPIAQIMKEKPSQS